LDQANYPPGKTGGGWLSLPFPVALFVAIAVLVLDPAVRYPVVARTLADPAALDPDVLMATIGPIPGRPYVPMTRGWDFDDPGCGRGDFDIDQRASLGQ